MKSLWEKIFGSASSSSSSNQNAKSRLHFVLVQDRTGLSNQEMKVFKGELVEVIEKYFQIDKDAFDLSYKREGDETALVINSPVMVKRSISKDVVKGQSTAGKATAGKGTAKTTTAKQKNTTPQQPSA